VGADSLRPRPSAGRLPDDAVAARPPAWPPARPAAPPSGVWLGWDDYAGLAPRHQDMVGRLLAGDGESLSGPVGGSEPGLGGAAGDSGQVPEICFAPGTPVAVTSAFAMAQERARARRAGDGVAVAARQLGSRWTSSATTPGGRFGLRQGDPITLTWSIVADGTQISGGSGEPSSPSALRAWLNGRYGSEAVWRPLLAQVFAEWAAVSGVTYVFEPADDGAAFPTSAGLAGVRGDIRLSGHPIDGNFNVLAYNYFPQQGDMVLDTSDSYFADTADTSRKLRAVVAHEHGHGLALRHVCPQDSTKLMEPQISALSGPQLDDIYSVQRLYGDRDEPNDSAAAATTLGALAAGRTVRAHLSIDDNDDQDFYLLEAATGGLSLTVTVRPIGATYLEGAQNAGGSCSAGTSFNSLARHDLSLELRAADGSTVLAAAAAAAAGEEEILPLTSLPPGPHFLRIAAAGNSDVCQLYELEVTMIDSSTPREVAVADASASEIAGAATVSVTVTPAAWQTVSVEWRTVGDPPSTATAGEDFQAASGTLVIPAGSSQATLSVALLDDALDEPDETFLVELTGATQASLADSWATVTVVDNDAPPTLTVSPAGAREESGEPLAFAAVLSAPSGRPVSVDWTTASPGAAQASAGLDYLPASGTLVLAPGQTDGEIGPITILDDRDPETDETLTLILANPINTTLPIPSLLGRIYDDEGPALLAGTTAFASPDPQGQNVLAWQAVVGRHYVVELSSDLQAWVPLPGTWPLTARQTGLTFTDSTPGAVRKYYRILDVPPP